LSATDQAQASTGIGPAKKSSSPGSELFAWPEGYDQECAGASSEPERDLYRMATSADLYSFQISPREASGFPGERFSGERAGRDRFLSERDRQYIKALVIMGYQDEAVWLVRKAYASRRQERDAARAREEQRLGHPVLLTRFDIDYLETLLLVGDRRNALDLFLQAMDDYQLNGPNASAPRDCHWPMLEKEYREAIEAIESGKPSSPSTDGAKPRPRGGSLRSLFQRLFRPRSPPKPAQK